VRGEGEKKKTKVRKRTDEVRKTKIETGGQMIESHGQPFIYFFNKKITVCSHVILMAISCTALTAILRDCNCNCLAGLRRGAFSCAEWQVTLCYPIWQLASDTP